MRDVKEHPRSVNLRIVRPFGKVCISSEFLLNLFQKCEVVNIVISYRVCHASETTESEGVSLKNCIAVKSFLLIQLGHNYKFVCYSYLVSFRKRGM